MNKTSSLYNLPDGWIMASLQEIITLEYGKNLVGKNRKQGNYPVYGSNGIIGYHNEYLIEGPVIIIGRKGAVGTVHMSVDNCWPIDTTYFIRPLKSISFKFIYFLLQSLNLKNLDRSTTIPGLNRDNVYSLKVALPPTNEQYQIVQIIEEFFSDLQEAEQSLSKATKLLSVYEYVILKHAFEGNLTKSWRNQNQTESAFRFLSDLSKKRKSDYDEAILNKSKVKLRDINYDFEFSSHKEISSWATAKLDKLIGISARVGWKGLKREEYTSSGPLFLSVHSLNYGKVVRFQEAFHISDERYDESPEIMLKIDDVLLCKDGAGIGKIGIVKSLPSKATVNSSILIVRAGDVFDPDFLYYLFRGPQMQRLVNDRIFGSAIPHLFQKDIKEFILNVPPIDEQKQIVQEIEYRFTIMENLKNAIRDNQSRSEILKQIILNKSFSGKLSSQDNSSERENDLLEKIIKERSDFLDTQKELAKVTPKPVKIMEERKSILQVLELNGGPLSAKEVWLQSKHKDDIESFYSELREIQDKIVEIKKDTESLLSLRHEN
jgi:type I restriction enzyme S subunit